MISRVLRVAWRGVEAAASCGAVSRVDGFVLFFGLDEAGQAQRAATVNSSPFCSLNCLFLFLCWVFYRSLEHATALFLFFLHSEELTKDLKQNL